jgi:CheY-like chemotaxis protein
VSSLSCTISPTTDVVAKKLRVLLVEDTASVRKVTTHLLQREGFEVVTATNGVEALDVLSKEVFDVVLMDLHMPVMDGIEAVKRLRAREAAAEVTAVSLAAAAAVALVAVQIPSGDFKVPTRNLSVRHVVVALTANSAVGLGPEVKEVGFDHFLEKPISVDKLRVALAKLLE